MFVCFCFELLTSHTDLFGFISHTALFLSKKNQQLYVQNSQSNVSINHTESNNRWNRLLSSAAIANDDDDDVRNDYVQNNENFNSDYFFHDDGPMESDFGDGMRSILDVVHPDLTSPEKDDDSIPTLLMPWRGDKKNTTMKRRTSFSSRNSLSRGSLNSLIGGRQ